jgi:intein/homing endonuclease
MGFDLRKNFMPVRRDTPIPLLDGRTITIEQLANEYEEGKVNYVYSIQDDTHRIVPGKVDWCGKNYTAEKLYKITLDDGTSCVMAGEHEVIMRDGSKKRADEVNASESLPSGYKTAQNAHSAALAAFKAKRFDESKAKMQEAEKLFASLRNDVINAVLELAEGHKTAERWELCQQEAEKVLKWEKENQKAIALKEIAEKNHMPLVSERFVEACRSSKWDVAAGLIGNVDKTNVNVQFYLGFMYEKGRGVTKDDYEAVKWYRKAAEQGVEQAKSALKRLG